MTTSFAPQHDTAAHVIDFNHGEAGESGAIHLVCARGQNFLVRWAEGPAGSASLPVRSGDEMMVLVTAGRVSAQSDGHTFDADAGSVMILTPGAWTLALSGQARCAVLSSVRDEAGGGDGAVNASGYAVRDPALLPVGRPYQREWGAARAQVLAINDVKASPDKPRLKMLQSATLSINWVEYEGPRDRAALSPHQHRDFEQGSLAMAGEFVHHLRSEWGADAGQWKKDVHARVGSPSLLVVPARTIHTSEGVGPGKHLLIDIFSPPRADFIANGWVFNATDYAAEAP
jgi:hypothetical protein